jgi:hypothetical protein
MLIRKLPKKSHGIDNRPKRFRSQRHLRHVRSHACCACNSEVNIQAAHYSLGSNSGMGQKADDWRCTPLCMECHIYQHMIGEQTFWSLHDPLAIIEALIRTSPVRREIEAHRNG